jgi:hypothetical protein
MSWVDQLNNNSREPKNERREKGMSSISVSSVIQGELGSKEQSLNKCADAIAKYLTKLETSTMDADKCMRVIDGFFSGSSTSTLQWTDADKYQIMLRAIAIYATM